MRLFYFHIVAYDSSIYSKIKDHIKVFESYVKNGELESFSYVQAVETETNVTLFALNDGKKVTFKRGNSKLTTIYNVFYAYPKLLKVVLNYLILNGFTHIYIRRSICDKSFIDFIRIIKEHGIKILYEIPTYPYDKEFPPNSRMIKIDQKYRNFLSKYVDFVITPSPGHNCIFNIPTIYIPNGIDVARVKPVSFQSSYSVTRPINLIAVAGLSDWHAYERLIRGINYYIKSGGKREVVFHIVGGSPDNQYRKLYEKLVNDYDLTDKVLFYGNCYGNDLDKIYDKADIGVGSLGVHRLGISIMTTLKSREYLAKGLPMICEGRIDIIPDDYKYLLKVPLDETSIDINEVISFYDFVYGCNNDRKTIIKNIRDFAFANCDIYKLMKKILYI